MKPEHLNDPQAELDARYLAEKRRNAPHAKFALLCYLVSGTIFAIKHAFVFSILISTIGVVLSIFGLRYKQGFLAVAAMVLTAAVFCLTIVFYIIV